MKATDWVRRRFLHRALAGVLLVALGVGIFATLSARANDRVANGVAISGQVVWKRSQGISVVRVRYEYDIVYETTLRATFGSITGSGSRISRGGEVTVYIDRDDPHRAAMPGGYTSDSGYWLVLSPIPLLVWGSTLVVMTVVRRFRHRVALDANFRDLGNLDLVPDLAVGVAIDSSLVQRWLPAYQRLRGVLPGDPGNAGLRIRVMLHVDASDDSMDFRGVRVGPLSRKRRLLMANAVVSRDESESPDVALRSTLARAVDSVIDFVEKRQLSVELPDLRAILRSLPQPSTTTDKQGEEFPEPPNFGVVFRGYDIAQVDSLIGWIQRAAESDDTKAQALARYELKNRRIRVKLRGYDREQVDIHLNLLEDRLAVY